jgi:hypothetical protein
MINLNIRKIITSGHFCNEMDQEYEVESILEKGKGEDGQDLYKIKWKGYSESEFTWEPLENL